MSAKLILKKGNVGFLGGGGVFLKRIPWILLYADVWLWRSLPTVSSG